MHEVLQVFFIEYCLPFYQIELRSRNEKKLNNQRKAICRRMRLNVSGVMPR